MRSTILAGGAASRFGGKPKGLERVGGERIFDRVVRSVQEATGQAPIVVANAPEASEWSKGLTVVDDVIPDCGTLSGLYTAVAHHTSPTVVLAWDLPFVSSELVGALIGGSSAFDVFLPASDGPLGVEPLYGVYGPACAGPIKQAIEDEDYRATSFHDGLRIGTLPLAEVQRYGDPKTLFFNVNTPSDLKRAEELWRSQHE